MVKSEYRARVGGPPTRPPSKLPPPGDHCLHASLQPDRLGHGRVGSVYSITIDGPGAYSLPPLVIKVAARHRSEMLAREAWFYEEMEYIQGSSIARCYGLFTAEIDSSSEVMDWAESDETYDPDEVDDSEDDDDDSEGEGDNNSPEFVWRNTLVGNENVPPELRGAWPWDTNPALNHHTHSKKTLQQNMSQA